MVNEQVHFQGDGLADALPNSLSDDLPGSGADPGEEAHRHGERFETWTLRSERPLHRDALERFAAGLPAGIHRAKGFVVLADDPIRPHLFQLVGNRWSLEPAPPGSALAGGSALVLIGHRGAATADGLRQLLAEETGAEAAPPSAAAMAADPLHR